MKARAFGWGGLLGGVAIAAAAVWTAIALVTWRSLSNGARFGSPWTAVDGQALLFSTPPQPLAVLGAVALNLLAMVLGYAWVVRPAWGGRRLASTPWLVAAGMIPGMLIMLAFARLTTLILPNTIAPGVVWAGDLLGAGAALWGLRREAAPSHPVLARAAAFTLRRDLALLLAVFAALLLFGVQIDRMHVMGSASQDFIREIYLKGPFAVGAPGHFPLISQHYDEPAYLYPLVYGLLKPGEGASATMTAVYWITLAACRLSLSSLIYLAVRTLGLDRLSALALTLFVWAASLSLNPAASNVLFDSLSPLAATLHPSRVLAPIAPLLMIAFSVGLTRKPGPGGLLVAAAIGAGLSAMTASLALALVWGAGVIVMTAVSPAGAAASRLWAAGAAVGALILAAFSFSYGFQDLPAPLRAGALLAVFAVGGLILLAAALTGWLKREDQQRLEPLAWLASLAKRNPIASLQALGPSTPYWASVALGYAVGFILFGNVLARAWQKHLGPLWPWGGVQYWDRYFGSLAMQNAKIMQPSFCADGHAWGYRLISEHCGSLPMFVRAYGLSMVAITAVLGWWLRRRPQAHGFQDRTLTMLFWGAALCLLAQPPSFIAYDFIFSPGIREGWARHLSVWLRNRLIESWFYSGVLLALVLFLRGAGPRARFWAQSAMLAAVVVYFLDPLTMPAQMVLNAAYLGSAIFGLR